MTSPSLDQKALAAALLPCPFCGGVKVAVSHVQARDRVVCADCGANGPSSWRGGPNADAEKCRATEAQSIAAWNTRASLPAPEPVAWISEQTLETLTANDAGTGAYNKQIANVSFSRFTVPLYASPPSPQGLREALWNCANLLDVMAEDAQKNDRTADWSMMSVMAERARAALQSQPSPSGETK